jgi:hypothetical protein
MRKAGTQEGVEAAMSAAGEYEAQLKAAKERKARASVPRF